MPSAVRVVHSVPAKLQPRVKAPQPPLALPTLMPRSRAANVGIREASRQAPELEAMCTPAKTQMTTSTVLLMANAVSR